MAAKKPIRLVNCLGEVREFESFSDAARALNSHAPTMYQLMTGKRETFGREGWKLVKDNESHE